MQNTNTDIWIAGAFAAVIVDLIVYPGDTLKTRIQSPNYAQVYKDPRTGAVRRHVLFRGLYQGVWSVILSTIPGSGAFFTTYEAVKYTLSNASSTNASSAIPSQNRLPITHSLPSPVVHALASSSAEIVACLMVTPAEVLKQNAQVVGASNNASSGGGGKTPAMMQVMRRFRHRPWKLWSGYTALVGRNLPFTGLQFPIFESVRGRVVEWRERSKQHGHEQADPDSRSQAVGNENEKASGNGNGNRNRKMGFENTSAHADSDTKNAVIERAVLTGFSASVSGTIASVVTTPIDVVKTRMMLSACEANNSNTKKDNSGVEGEANARRKNNQPGQEEERKKSTPKSKAKAAKGTLAVGKQIFRKEGIHGLFRGGAIRAVWSAVSLSMYMSIYEAARMNLENRRKAMDGLSGQSNRQEKGAI